MYKFSAATLLLCVSVSVWALQKAENPFWGTWESNPERTAQGRPGDALAAAPTGPPNVIKREPFGKDGEKFTSDRVDAQGNKVHIEYSAEYDGKEYPITGDTRRDSIAIKRIDSHTLQLTYKKQGKVVQETTRTISKDGKTQTTSGKTLNAQGEWVPDYAIWEKQ